MKMPDRRTILLSLTLPFASGCGYRPLYSKVDGGPDVAAALANISVQEQKTRPGQLLRNELLSSMSPAGTGGTNQYLLRIAVIENASFVSRLPDQPVDRWRYRLDTTYELVDVKLGRVATRGSSQSAVSFDTVREPVADRQARNTAMSRAAVELGQDIKLRLAAFLSK
jgi:LPS-assembly lipoprotein